MHASSCAANFVARWRRRRRDVAEPVSQNAILGLTSKGAIVSIGMRANGTETDLGFPKFNGTELRNLGAIAKADGETTTVRVGEEVLNGAEWAPLAFS
jgi:hypothetical protein